MKTLDKYQIMKAVEKLDRVDLRNFKDLFDEYYMRKLEEIYEENRNKLQRFIKGGKLK